MPSSSPVIDKDEYGEPVSDRYRRLGAGSEMASDTGLYVRFEPGFGLNVHIGLRIRDIESRMVDDQRMVLGIGGWERLGELVDEWRAREAEAKR